MSDDDLTYPAAAYRSAIAFGQKKQQEQLSLAEENERLRAALRKFLCHFHAHHPWEDEHPDGDGCSADETLAVHCRMARSALAGTEAEAKDG